jgi:hypothetical protein
VRRIVSAKSITAAILVLMVAAFGTWLFLPLITQPANVELPPTTFITPVGPFEVNWMLLVLLAALGAPMPALILALLLRWFGRKAAGGATPALVGEAQPVARTARAKAKTVATTQPEQAVAQQELSTAWKFILLAVIGVAIVGFGLLVIAILPPGFQLF